MAKLHHHGNDGGGRYQQKRPSLRRIEIGGLTSQTGCSQLAEDNIKKRQKTKDATEMKDKSSVHKRIID
jgi:hypothetical protein